MELQSLLVAICVLAAVGYLLRALLRSWIKSCDRGCGCSAPQDVRTDRVNLA